MSLNEGTGFSGPWIHGAGLQPDDFPNLEAWWEASTITGLSNGDPITSWPDLSTNARTATPTTGTPPVWNTGIFGLSPSVFFSSAVDRSLEFSSISIPVGAPGDGAFTVLAVVMSTSATDSMILGNSSTNIQFRRYRSGTNNISKYFNSLDQLSSNFTTALNNPVLCVWKRADGVAGSGSFRENTTARSTFSDSAAAPINRIGRTNFGNFAVMHMGAILVYTEFLTDNDVDNLYLQYFRPKYNLP